MDPETLKQWFAANKELLENAYLTGEQPWQQSGFGLHHRRTYEEWMTHRKPIADAISTSGTLLDIGCANGFLLECILIWTAERGITITPFGLDLSDRLISLARERFPRHMHHLFVGNAWDWDPPQRFDYVRTELVYVPDELHRDYVTRILNQYLNPGGHLLAAEYRGKDEAKAEHSIDRDLAALGFKVEEVRSASWEGLEKTRVAVMTAPTTVADRN